MKRILALSFTICLCCIVSSNAKVLVVVEALYYILNGTSAIDPYVADVRKIDHKQVDLITFSTSTDPSVHVRCAELWTLIRDKYQEYQNSSPEDPLEGVVLIGNLPIAWCIMARDINGVPSLYVPDDRYFMNIVDNTKNPPVCYTDDATLWQFDGVYNAFDFFNTGYGDLHLDIWVSRVTANQIRMLRGDWGVMDEYGILNSYFIRVHDRMREPAKVPAWGFSMGGITEWEPNNDPITKLGFMELNLQRLYKFYWPDNTPANWLLQLVWGPWGGTTLGAFNGERYADIGRNHITNTFSTLYDFKTNTPITITSADTVGYEWAGIFEHSDAFCHVFNRYTGTGESPMGGFGSGTFGKLWDDNWKFSGNGSWNGTYYKYNPDYLPNPYNTYNNARGQGVTFKAKIPAGYGGTYHVYVYYIASSTNNPLEWGRMTSFPNDYNFASRSCPSVGFVFDQTQHKIEEIPGNNWEFIADCDFLENDSASVGFSIDGNPPPWNTGDLIADAVKFVGPAGTLIVDNEDPGFSCGCWYSRNFEDMQDEDPVYHRSYSKTPFFISSGCSTGNFLFCYDWTDITHMNLQSQLSDNLGLLYGMGHNGLAALSSAIGYPGHLDCPFTPYTSALVGMNGYCQPNTFGDALQAIYNTDGDYFDNGYVLIGAGTLKAGAYVPYGTQMEKLINIYVSGTDNFIYPDNLVWMENFIVTPTGTCNVQGSEVRIYPESDLQGEVHISLAN